MIDLSVIDEIIRTHQDQPSVKQIKNVITTSNTAKPIYFSFEPTNPVEVQKGLENINTKKATGFDKITPKLVKLSAEVLRTPLSISINDSLKLITHREYFPMTPKSPQLFRFTKVNQTKMKFPILGP